MQTVEKEKEDVKVVKERGIKAGAKFFAIFPHRESNPGYPRERRRS